MGMKASTFSEMSQFNDVLINFDDEYISGYLTLACYECVDDFYWPEADHACFFTSHGVRVDTYRPALSWWGEVIYKLVQSLQEIGRYLY